MVLLINGPATAASSLSLCYDLIRTFEQKLALSLSGLCFLLLGRSLCGGKEWRKEIKRPREELGSTEDEE